MFAYELNYDIINAPDAVSLRNAFKDFLKSESIGKDYIEHLGSGCLFISSLKIDNIEYKFKSKFDSIKIELSNNDKHYYESELLYSFNYIYINHKIVVDRGDKNKILNWITRNRKHFLQTIQNSAH